MAATYYISTGAAGSVTALGASIHYLYLRNLHATKIARVYRMWAKNTMLGTAFSGAPSIIQIALASGYTSGGTSVTPFKRDSNSATPTLGTELNSLRATGITGVSVDTVIRQVLLINEELTAKTAFNSEVLCGINALSCIWDSGYGEANIQPITLRQNQGVTIWSPASGVTAGGGYDFSMEFTWE
jgi:hypothetical protein